MQMFVLILDEICFVLVAIVVSPADVRTDDVELFASKTGVGVRATDPIYVNINIASYTGFVTDFNYDDAEGQNEYVIGQQSNGKNTGGTMAKFVNHSCAPNTQFVEKILNRNVHVIVQATREIKPDEEVTVDY
ncbi:SET domain protein [Phytophthora megakarya]|uniref:SET domain protein n=1 Tax=Phytophthora megakarya TaxID=4795 RepID=A0A225WK59_9STRA|nr:SET domain protein [Phytophthora megakarya]